MADVADADAVTADPTIATRNGPILSWLEDALRTERYTVDLALSLQHAALLRELGPRLNCALFDPLKMPAPYVDAPASRADCDLQATAWRQSVQPPGTPTTPSSSFLPEDEESPMPAVVILTEDTMCQTQVKSPENTTRQPQSSNMGTTSNNSANVLKELKDVLSNQEWPLDDNRSLKSRWRGRRNGTETMMLMPGEGALHVSKVLVNRMLAHQRFDAIVGVIIVVNSILMGVETTFELEGRDTTVFRVLEYVFLAFYSCELALRFFAHGCACLKNPWVLFDLVLVCIGLLSHCVIGPILDSGQDESVKESIAGLLVLRMLRLFRLARAVRLLVQFKTLWMLVRGLIGSATTIAYTFGLIVLILYIFACMAMELITKKHLRSPDSGTAEFVAEYFPDVPVAMLTLLQFVCMDSIGSIYRPLILQDPMLVIFFLPFILVVSVALMNLVTAVIVEGAIEQGKNDRETQRRYKQHAFKKMIPGLRVMFHELDTDGNGTVSLEELINAPQDVKLKVEDIMQVESLVELFEIVDADNSGVVDIDEFCDGISKLVNSTQTVEVVRILKQLALSRSVLEELSMTVHRMEYQTLDKGAWG